MEQIREELITDIESHIRLNDRGEVTDRLTLDYIKLELAIYRRKKERLSEGRSSRKKEPRIFYSDEKSAQGYASTKTN